MWKFESLQIELSVSHVSEKQITLNVQLSLEQKFLNVLKFMFTYKKEKPFLQSHSKLLRISFVLKYFVSRGEIITIKT